MEKRPPLLLSLQEGDPLLPFSDSFRRIYINTLFQSSHYFHLLACEFYLSVESLTVFSSDVFSHARNFYPRVFI